MGFSKYEYWSGLPCPSPGDHPNPGIQPRSPTLQADSLPFQLLTQSCLTLATPWTIAYQAPPPMGFSRQEYWSGVLLPSHRCSVNPCLELVTVLALEGVTMNETGSSSCPCRAYNLESNTRDKTTTIKLQLFKQVVEITAINNPISRFC